MPDELPKKPNGNKKFTVFASTRKPYQRMVSLWKYMDPDGDSLEEWYNWVIERDDPFKVHIKEPYSYWTDRCDRVIKVEDIESRLPTILKDLGFNPPIPAYETTKYDLTPEEYEFIATTRHKDFSLNGYKLDRRTKI